MAADLEHTVEEFAAAAAALLPTGPAWPRERDTTLMRVLYGQSEIWASVVQARARQLATVEAFPDTADEMLADWERVAGLPGECYEDVPQTPAARRAVLTQQLTSGGGQSRAYFIGLAQSFGHPDARISEFSPVRCGVSRCGSPRWRMGGPEQRFVWRMYVGPSALSWFRMGRSRCGADPQARIRRAAAVECIVNRWKPAHTTVVFLYSFPKNHPRDITWFRMGRSRCGAAPQAKVNAWGAFTDVGPAEITWFRMGRNRCGRDCQARIVTNVVR